MPTKYGKLKIMQSSVFPQDSENFLAASSSPPLPQTGILGTLSYVLSLVSQKSPAYTWLSGRSLLVSSLSACSPCTGGGSWVEYGKMSTITRAGRSPNPTFFLWASSLLCRLKTMRNKESHNNIEFNFKHKFMRTVNWLQNCLILVANESEGVKKNKQTKQNKAVHGRKENDPRA